VFAEGEWAQTLVLKDNSDAANLLTSGRGGLPNYHPSGTYQTWFLRDQKVQTIDPSIQIRRATAGDFDDMQQLQNQVDSTASYTSILDFSAMPKVDFLLAYKHERLVGMIGLWDLTEHKSTIVANYSLPFHLARPVYNLWAAIRNLPKLPPSGGKLNAYAITAVLCQNREPAILRSLLAKTLEQPGLFAIGLDSTDPLTAALTRLKSHTTTADHYLVGFSSDPPQSPKPFYFDFARL
jgi:hypothetical protein